MSGGLIWQLYLCIYVSMYLCIYLSIYLFIYIYLHNTSVVSIVVHKDRYHQWYYMCLPYTLLHTSLYSSPRSSHCRSLKQKFVNWFVLAIPRVYAYYSDFELTVKYC